MARAAFHVARMVERLQHLFAQLGAFAQDRLQHFGRRLLEAGQIVVALQVQHLVQYEQAVLDGGCVAGHETLLEQIGSGARCLAQTPARPFTRPGR